MHTYIHTCICVYIYLFIAELQGATSAAAPVSPNEATQKKFESAAP